MRGNKLFSYGAAIYLGLPPVLSVIFTITGLPIPSYVFVSLLIFISVIYLIALRKKIFIHNNRHIYIYFTFGILIYSLGGAWGSDSSTAPLKMLNIGYAILTPIAVLMLARSISKDNNDIICVNKIYYNVFTFATCLMVIFFIFFRIPANEGRFILPGIENPIWVSRHIAAGLLVYILYKYSVQGRLRLAQIGIASIVFGVLILSGSRGPVIASIFSGLVYVYKIKNNSAKSIAISITLVLVLLGLFGVAFESYVYDSNFYSVYHRFDSILFAINQPFAIWGNGLSSFGLHYTGDDIYSYPHNILAELYFEIGMVGIALFLGLTWIIFRVYTHSIPGILAFYYYLNAMSSGDVPGNASLFIATFVSWVIYCHNNSIIKNRMVYK